MNKKKKILLIVISTIVLVGACIGIYFLSQGTKTKEIKSGDFTILKGLEGKEEKYDLTLYVEGYEGSYDKAYYVIGTVKSDKAYKQVFVTFDLLDKKDNKIGEAIAGLSDVEKGKEYKIKALGTVSSDKIEEIASFKLNSIRGE